MKAYLLLLTAFLLSCSGTNKETNSSVSDSVVTNETNAVTTTGFSFFESIKDRLPIAFPNDSIQDPTQQLVYEAVMEIRRTDANYMLITTSEDPTEGGNHFWLKLFSHDGKSVSKTLLYTNEDSEHAYKFIENNMVQIISTDGSPEVYYMVSKNNAVLKSVGDKPVMSSVGEITEEEFMQGKVLENTFGNLHPEDANYTNEEVLTEEARLLDKVALAERHESTLVIGQHEYTSAPRNEFWFQGQTSQGYLVSLNVSVTDGIGYRTITVIAPDGSTVSHLSNTLLLYELPDGRLVQLSSHPTPGKPNGSVVVWDAGNGHALVQHREIRLNNQHPVEVRLVNEHILYVSVASDDTGELPLEYLEIKI